MHLKSSYFSFQLLLFFCNQEAPFGYIEALPNFIGSASLGQVMDPCRDDLVPTSVLFGGGGGGGHVVL
jgi:hypothetical protein